MKNLIICLLLFSFIGVGHSQIMLKEARVTSPVSLKIDPDKDLVGFLIPEKNYGEFHKDPLEFVKQRFSSLQLARENMQSNYDGYFVTFKTQKGHLAARFNQDGELVSSYQAFKNVPLPDEAKLQILEKYRDANVKAVKFVATTKGWEFKKQVYKVKIVDGDKTRRLRIHKNMDKYSLAGL